MAFFGVCYAPYRIGSPHKWPDPNGPTAATVDADMQAIASRKFTHIRTYGVDKGNQWNVDKATKYGLFLGLGVWVYPDSLADTKAQIDDALRQAQSAATTYKRILDVDLVIGNEVDRTDVAKYEPALIQQAMQYAKGELGKYPGVTAWVTTCFSGTVLQKPSKWEPVVDYCDKVAYLTVYPWYAGQGVANPENIDPQMKWSWDNGLKQVVARGKQVVIAEIGWPSAGRADATVNNERINFGVTKRWISGHNSLGRAFETYWFEMFDEPWKTDEGAQGPHWGLYTSGTNPQPKFEFSGESTFTKRD